MSGTNRMTFNKGKFWQNMKENLLIVRLINCGIVSSGEVGTTLSHFKLDRKKPWKCTIRDCPPLAGADQADLKALLPAPNFYGKENDLLLFITSLL